MKVKSKAEKPKGSKNSVLRGPKVPKKMKMVNKVPKKTKTTKPIDEPVTVISPKISKPEKKTTTSESITLNITPKLVRQGVDGLLKLHNEGKESGKTLLLDDKENVFLQVVFVKKPEVPEPRRKYIKLHHSVYGDDPEICLFVKDYKAFDKVKRTPDEKIEYSVDHYQEFLNKHKVEGITTIMPTFQFRTEFDSYELRRKLVDRFDLFLCQSSLLDQGSFLKNLGIAWNKKNKLPLALKFPSKDDEVNSKFKDNVAELIKTTWFSLKPHGDTIAIRVGTVNQTAEQLSENISYVLHQFQEKNCIPGGMDNIKSLMLKTSRSKALPLYINLASRNSVAVPIVPSIKPSYEAVVDELSTKPGKKVTVLPSGDVFVTADDEKLIPEWKDELSDEEEFFNDSEPEDEKSSDEEDAAPKKKKQKIEENDDSDQEAEKAEEQYLTSWNQKADDESDEEEKPKKKAKVVKTKKEPVKKKQAKSQEKKKSPEKKKAPEKKKIAEKKKSPEKKKIVEKKKSPEKKKMQKPKPLKK